MFRNVVYSLANSFIWSKQFALNIMYLMRSSAGVATGGMGWGLDPSLCGICDIIFSYIYTNTTNLVFHLSYLA